MPSNRSPFASSFESEAPAFSWPSLLSRGREIDRFRGSPFKWRLLVARRTLAARGRLRRASAQSRHPRRRVRAQAQRKIKIIIYNIIIYNIQHLRRRVRAQAQRGIDFFLRSVFRPDPSAQSQPCSLSGSVSERREREREREEGESPAHCPACIRGAQPDRPSPQTPAPQACLQYYK